jgi:hypothetical protein
MVRITGAAAASGAAGTNGLTLPGYEVTIVGVSLIACGKFIAPSQAHVCLDYSDRAAGQTQTKETERPCRELNQDGSANPLKSLLTVR